MKLKKFNNYKSNKTKLKSMLEFKNNETEMDETDYLLSTEANKKKLLEGVRQAEAGETISVNEELEKI